MEVFKFEAVILPCMGLSWREDILCFNRRESVNNFVYINSKPDVQIKATHKNDSVPNINLEIRSAQCLMQIYSES